MKDPQIYLRRLGIHLTCPIHPGQKAFIDREFRAFVNHESYFFSSREARAQFEKQPLRFCGLLTDPVRGERFQPTRRSPRLDHEGRPYFFSSQASKDAFVKDPVRYANAKRIMPPMMRETAQEVPPQP